MSILFSNLEQIATVTHWLEGYATLFSTPHAKPKYRELKIGDTTYYFNDEEQISLKPLSKYRRITIPEIVTIINQYDPDQTALNRCIMQNATGDIPLTDRLEFHEHIELLARVYTDVMRYIRYDNDFNIATLSDVTYVSDCLDNLRNWAQTKQSHDKPIPLYISDMFISGHQGYITVGELTGERYFSVECDDQPVMRYVLPNKVAGLYNFGSKYCWCESSPFTPTYRRSSRHERVNCTESRVNLTEVILMLNKMRDIMRVGFNCRQPVPDSNIVVIFDGYFVDNVKTITDLTNLRLHPDLVEPPAAVTVENLTRCSNQTVVMVGSKISDNLKELVTQIASQVVIL